MFTGIVSHIGKVIDISHPDDWELLVDIFDTSYFHINHSRLKDVFNQLITEKLPQ